MEIDGWFIAPFDRSSHRYVSSAGRRLAMSLCGKYVDRDHIGPPIGKQPCKACYRKQFRRNDVP